MLQQFGELVATIGPWLALVAFCVSPVWCYLFARMVLKTLRCQGQAGATVKARTFPLPHVEITINGPAAGQIPAAYEQEQLPASKPRIAERAKRRNKTVGKP
ncbi:hypothetical protein SAMN05216188_104239 [Lentzea xinjiangensis]|uniref:Uncharacterized protein n=1 Tax=Lentzea xinjiangensis TaxID=402600 RepID=A0A1H9HXB6_9PSEU|nr:hypothetical protein [Lentzea xinjiangensis]SEQ66845.1 hypothetical protein SAMN05216188_104239 [Lentzea xinjiangensis]